MAFACAVVLAALVMCMPAVALGASDPETATAAADNLRTGWYPEQAGLTSQLEKGSFGRVFATSVQGQVFAQPLVADGTLLVATEQDWVYGMNPNTGAVNWSRQLGSPLKTDLVSCWPIEPYVGVTGAPVVDAATGVAYLVSISYESGNSGPVAWYMRAINIGTGSEEPGFPVKIEGQAQNLQGTTFLAERELQRPALLLMGGVVYAAFGGGNCDLPPYGGWVVGVSTSGQIKALWASASEGASIWQSGSGLVSDGAGRIEFATGNQGGSSPSPPPGPGNAPPAGLGESVVRLEVQPDGTLQVADFFSPANNLLLDEYDLDQGSGGPMALPPAYFGTPGMPDLILQVGKTGELYMLNGEALGGMGQGPGGVNNVVQELGPYGGVWGGMAVWPGDGGYVYVPSVASIGAEINVPGELQFFKYSVNNANEPRLSPVAASPEPFWFGSGSPIVTSNGIEPGSAIVWITRCQPSVSSCTQAELLAYAAVPSSGAPSPLWRESIGYGPKFMHPAAYEGHIYVGTRGEQVIGFAARPLAPLTVQVTGSGTVNSSPAGIADCGPAPRGICTAEFSGEVTLTATSGSGYTFAGWFGGCKQVVANTCTVVVAAETEIAAVFIADSQGKEGGEGREGGAGKEGPPGSTGKEGPPGLMGKEGSPGLMGKEGSPGLMGKEGPPGSTGKMGPAGAVGLVRCKAIKQGRRTAQRCTVKLIPGPVKLPITATRALLTRHGVVFAAGTATATYGSLRLALVSLRGLRPSRYTLTLISGTGRHKRVLRETLMLS